MGKKKITEIKRQIESYQHKDKERVNNPPVGLVTPETDPVAGRKKRYSYDPHLDPQLVWAGKAEHISFEVPTVSLHVHERIDPKTIIQAVRKKNGESWIVDSLFEQERNEPIRQAIEFYQHKHGWTNRLIAGDSLLVMNSLLEKEGMGGKVQMIYIDPPYGIKYGSNFQPFVNKRDVKDGKDEDLTSEPEQIKAFRDTWELGIHSYLTYMRDRLLLARELLHESGSIFVQISDENLHHIRELMDEVFGAMNFITIIQFRTASTKPTNLLSGVCDFIIWYAKSKNNLKYRELFVERDEEFDGNDLIEYNNIVIRYREAKAKKINFDRMKVFTTMPLVASTLQTEYKFNHRGKIYDPVNGWRVSENSLKMLAYSNRIVESGNQLRYKKYYSDFSYTKMNATWVDLWAEQNKTYVVQTNKDVLKRCILMTTDPGDLVFDPTCGSGTTAYVAEQWGRRWITCDTSRVAIAIARQRLMTAVFDYYELAHPDEGVGSGFKYKSAPHITLKSIANNPDIDVIYNNMHPMIEKALKELNKKLKGKPLKYKVTQGGRSGEFVDFKAPDSATFTMPSGQVVKVNELLEWEVPFEFPDDWPDDTKKPFEEFHYARRSMQKKMDETIIQNADQEVLYDQPYVDRKKVRVTGPFTVEAVPAPTVKSIDEVLEQKIETADLSIVRSSETLRQAEWRDELLKSGIRGKAGQYIRFSRLEPLPGCRWLHADGETKPSNEGANSFHEEAPAYKPIRVVVSFGPEHGPLEQRQVAQAIEEAQKLVPKPSLIVFAAFQFDPEAAKDIDEINWPGVTLLKVQMNADLLTEDLKKKRSSNESFWLIGQPDIELRQEKDGRYVVEVHGFDYYNTKTGQVESGGKDKIAMWMLDTDYDGRSLFPRQVFFPMAGDDEGWAKLTKNLKAEIDRDLIQAYYGTVSLPFFLGEYRRIAIKIVDDRGIESLKIIEV